MPTNESPTPSPDNPLAELDRAAEAGYIFGSRLRLSILLVIKHRGPSTTEEIAKALAVSRPTVQRAAQTMRKDGIIEGRAEPPAYRPITLHINTKRLQQLLTDLRATLR